MPAPSHWTRVGAFAAASSSTEITAGSFLHSLHLPLAGHVLANLQGAMLSAFLDRDPERCRRVFWVSAVSGALKSLSPAGKRLRPMLAIFMQGALFHAAVNLLGPGLAGVIVGQALIGSWCGFQTFFFQYLLFGGDIVKSYEALFRLAGEYVPLPSPPAALAGWVGLNFIASAAFGGLVFRGLVRLGPVPEPAAPGAAAWPRVPAWDESLRRALREFGRPWFLGPFAFVLFFVGLAGGGWERAAWASGRAFLAAFLCALLLQRVDFFRLAGWLRIRGLGGPALALETAAAELRRRLQRSSE